MPVRAHRSVTEEDASEVVVAELMDAAGYDARAEDHCPHAARIFCNRRRRPIASEISTLDTGKDVRRNKRCRQGVIDQTRQATTFMIILPLKHPPKISRVPVEAVPT